MYVLKFCLSKSVWDFPFSIPFHFHSGLSFYSAKSMDFLTLDVIIPLKIKIIEKPHTILLPDLWFFFSFNKNFKIQWYLHELEVPRNWPGDKFFNLRKAKFWDCQFFSIVTFKYLTFLYLLAYLFL